MKKKNSITLGHYPFYFWKKSLKLDEGEIITHKLLVGLSGSGKSSLIVHLVTELMMMGKAVSILDPTGDLSLDIMRVLLQKGYFEKYGYHNFWYIDFSHKDKFLPFNILNQRTDLYDRYDVASQIVDACQRIWSGLDSGVATTFTTVMKRSVPVLVAHGLTLASLEQFLQNKPYRDSLLKDFNDQTIVDYFRYQVDSWNKNQTTMLNSSLSRAALLTEPPLRHLIGQKENKLDFRKIMDSGKSVIYNLGNVKRDTQIILGCLISVGMEQAARSRANIPEYERVPHQWIVDEWPVFASPVSAVLDETLSTIRKYKVTMLLANQHFSQGDAKLRDALENCMGIYFRLGKDDSLWVASKIGRFDELQFKQAAIDTRTLAVFQGVHEQQAKISESLMNLEKRECYVKGVKIRTVDVPLGQTEAIERKLDHLKSYYAAELLTPLDKILAPKPVEIPIFTKKRRNKVI